MEPNTMLCERMLSPYNLEVAVQNVKRNKGSAGVDGMGVEEIDRFMRTTGRGLGNRYSQGSTSPSL